MNDGSDDDDSGGDNIKIEIHEDKTSSENGLDGDESDDEIKNSDNAGALGRMSSDYVSSLRNPSLGHGRQSSSNHDSLIMN